MAVLTIDMVTLKALELYRNTNFLLQHLSMKYMDEFERVNAKIGYTLRIRVPSFYTYRTTMTAAPQATNETDVPLTADIISGVDAFFTTSDMALDLNSFGLQCLGSIVNTVAAGISQQVITTVSAQAQNIVATVGNNQFGNPASALISPNVRSLLQAGAVLEMRGVPPKGLGDRLCVLHPFSNATLTDTMSGFFNPVPAISGQFMVGGMSKGNLGMDLYGSDQMITTQTTGNASITANTTNANAQVGGTIVVAALTGQLNAGDFVTFGTAGTSTAVNNVNRLTGVDQGTLMQFQVQAKASPGATSISVLPVIIPSGTAGANATQAIPNGANVVPVTAPSSQYFENLVFNREAIELAYCPLPITGGMVKDGASSKWFDGVGMRCVQYYNGSTDENNWRFDTLAAATCTRPDWVVILADVVNS